MNPGDGHDYEEWSISGQHYFKCRRCGAVLGRDEILCRSKATGAIHRPGKETITDPYHNEGHRLRINETRNRKGYA